MRTASRAVRGAALATALLVVAPWAVGEAPASECSNAAVRSPVDLQLPDCRAYEQVSPVDKNGNDVGLGQPIPSSVAAADGSGVTYESLGVFPGAHAALITNTNLSRRGPSGWSTEVLPAPQAPLPYPDLSVFQYFTPNLGEAVVRTPPSTSLAPGDTPGANNLYLRDANGRYTTLSVSPPAIISAQNISYVFAGASTDLRHVLFASNDALTPDAPVQAAQNGLDNLYEWVDGQLRLVTILPDGTPAPMGGSPGGPIGAPTPTAMSEDGSRIVFGADGQIYLRENGTRTVLVSGSKRSAPDPNGPSQPAFWGASADGSKVFFSSQEALTDDATVGVVSLYRYDVDDDELVNLTVDADPGAPPGGGLAGVLAFSRDGSQGYFYSTRQYVSGQGVDGMWNLYRWHGDTVSFVVADDVGDPVAFEAVHKTARITPDGQHLVFLSSRSLTGFDNTDAVTGQPDSEVFLYDAPADRLTCVSCNPSGQKPTGPSTLTQPPARPTGNLQRGVSDDGRRVFFDSLDALVPADVNGKADVYEYADGAIHLLSSGSSSDDSTFASASASGDDVFFFTRERLVPADVDDNLDVYDARVGGGFGKAGSSRPCSGDACQPLPTPAPALSSPGTSSVSGQGNATPPVKPRARFQVATPSKSARRQMARTGTVALTVRVSEGGIVKARASRKVRGRSVTVASATKHALRAGTVHLRLRLAKSTRTALARGAKVRLALRVSFSHGPKAKTTSLELQR